MFKTGYKKYINSDSTSLLVKTSTNSTTTTTDNIAKSTVVDADKIKLTKEPKFPNVGELAFVPSDAENTLPLMEALKDCIKTFEIITDKCLSKKCSHHNQLSVGDNVVMITKGAPAIDYRRMIGHGDPVTKVGLIHADEDITELNKHKDYILDKHKLYYKNPIKSAYDAPLYIDTLSRFVSKYGAGTFEKNPINSFLYWTLNTDQGYIPIGIIKNETSSNLQKARQKVLPKYTLVTVSKSKAKELFDKLNKDDLLPMSYWG